MSAKHDTRAAQVSETAGRDAGKEVATIPTETLSAIAEMISRHPDEMLRIIRRWMDDEATE